MDFIKQNIGHNNVHVNIIPNKYEETIAINEYPPNKNDKFSKLDDLIAIFRPGSNNNTHENKHNPISDELSFKICCLIEPLNSLIYNIVDKNKKTIEFKTSLKNNLTNHNNCFKSLNLNKDCKDVSDIITSIDKPSSNIEDKRLMLIYLSKALERSIIVKQNNCIIFSNISQESEDGIVIDASNHYEITENVSNMSIISLHIKELKDKNICKSIDTVLLSHLKEIALQLNIDIYKVVENKRKLLLKGELKQRIIDILA